MSLKKIALAALISLSFGVTAAHATVVNFDDYPGNQNPVPNGYAGFNWNNATTVGFISKSTWPGSGYDHGTISGENTIFNYFGISPVDIAFVGGSSFTFNGAYFTSAWINQTISFVGKLNGVIQDTSASYSINTLTPLYIDLNWSNINELVIYNSGSQWALDNFTFTGVPEPASLALLGLGFAGLVNSRRKAKHA